MGKLALVFAFAACGGVNGDDDDDSVADAAVVPPDAAVVPPDAMTLSDAAPTSDAFPTTTYNGLVFLAEISGGPFMDQSSAFAGFTTGEVWGTPFGSFGDCIRYDGTFVDSYSAGTITVTGANLSPLTLAPSGAAPNVTYAPTVTPPVDLIDPADVLDISASGGTIPAFSGTVTVPGTIAGWTTPGTVDRSLDFATTWTAGSATHAWVMIQLIDSGTGDLAILLCETNDDGAYTVPQEAVALLPTTYDIVFAMLWRMNETVVFPTDATVFLWTGLVVSSDVLTYLP